MNALQIKGQQQIFERVDGKKDLSAVEFHLAPNSQLKHTRIISDLSSLTQPMRTSIFQAENSQYIGEFLFFNCVAPHQIDIKMMGDHSECQLKSLLINHHQEKMDLNVILEHCNPNCKSDILVRGIADDQATLSIQGKIIVNEQASHTQACLENKNLLLSPLAVIQTQPILEIYQKEVQCKHGATVGALDKQALFYLQSRGLSLEAARQFMIQAFLDPILSKLSTEAKQYVPNMFQNFLMGVA